VVLFSRTRLMILSSVRDVNDVLHVVTGEFQCAADEVGEDERTPVADVRVVIDGRSAAIHADFFFAPD